MKILLAVSRYPWPPRRGDQLRATQFLELAGNEHAVTLLAPEPPAGAPAPPAGVAVVTYDPRPAWVAGAAVGLARGLPFQCLPFTRPDLGAKLRRLSPEADLTVLQLARLAAHLPDTGGAPLAVDLIDALSLNFSRRAGLDRLALRPLLGAEARRLRRWERRLLESSRLGLVVTQRDREALAGADGRLADRVAVVPIAIPPPAAPLHTPPAGPPVLAFTGNLGYFVNADGLTHWLATAWPALAPLRRATGLRLVVAGDRPGRSLVRAVLRAGGELIASPPDLAPVLAGATVALAPLRGGAGVPIKVLEAWGAGVPVVASSWATAGTTGVAGEDLLVADSAAEWVAALASLLGDPTRRRRLAEAGRARLADYAPAAVSERLRAALASLVRPEIEKGPPAGGPDSTERKR